MTHMSLKAVESLKNPGGIAVSRLWLMSLQNNTVCHFECYEVYGIRRIQIRDRRNASVRLPLGCAVHISPDVDRKAERDAYTDQEKSKR